MKRFQALLDYSRHGDPGLAQQAANRAFGPAVRDSHLTLREPEQPLPGGQHFVLGVATYALPELALLDRLDVHLASSGVSGSLSVFNLAQCTSQADFRRYVPDSPEFDCSPVLGMYVNGRHRQSYQGLPAVRDALDVWLNGLASTGDAAGPREVA